MQSSDWLIISLDRTQLAPTMVVFPPSGVCKALVQLVSPFQDRGKKLDQVLVHIQVTKPLHYVIIHLAMAGPQVGLIFPSFFTSAKPVGLGKSSVILIISRKS